MPTSPVWWRLCGVSAVLAVATALLMAFSRSPSSSAPVPTPTAPTDESAAGTRAPEPLAIVGEWEGRLAVFPARGAPPTEVYDVFLSSLPPAEQETLAAGIPVFDEVSLSRLLEDYTG